MKRTERHHLKENEVANWVADLTGQYEAHKQTIQYGVLAVLVVLVAVAGTMAWRTMSAGKAASVLAEAMTVAEAPVTPPVAAEEGKLPVQPAGTFPSERARLEAALPKFQAVVDSYPSSQAGTIARYRLGATLVALGRIDEGIQRYKEVADQGAPVVSSMAKLGLADAQLAAGRYADAATGLKALTEKVTDELPLDGVLMQLGRACKLGGKPADAKQAFKRIVDEFPTSIYASDARRELDTL